MRKRGGWIAKAWHVCTTLTIQGWNGLVWRWNISLLNRTPMSIGNQNWIQRRSSEESPLSVSHLPPFFRSRGSPLKAITLYGRSMRKLQMLAMARACSLKWKLPILREIPTDCQSISELWHKVQIWSHWTSDQTKQQLISGLCSGW